ncbi:MAG: ATP-binding protein [Proteobacteria bacterium]|nr:ATP-binding protein [Pseudomonadota bacterium]
MIERRSSVSGEAAQLPTLSGFLRAFWSEAGLPAEGAWPFELALEEAFMNVVLHGSPGDRVAAVDVVLALDGDALTLTLSDDGPPFDPLGIPSPDTDAPLEARRPGGLGVHLVRRLMDQVGYARIAERNELRLRRRVTTAPPPA